MRPKPRTSGTGFVLLLGVVSLVFAYAGPASAEHGESTPGINVAAVNPGTFGGGSDLRVALTAHTEQSTAENPSCRPHDVTLDCWGSLVLRVPAAGGLTVHGFEVHRVAVGDIGCDDDNGDDGGCGGCGEDDEGCDGHEASGTSASTFEGPVQAQVNGVAVLKNPGDTGLPASTQVQLKFTLTHNGSAQYADELDLQINEFRPGPIKPELYRSGPQTIQQVQIHLVGSP